MTTAARIAKLENLVMALVNKIDQTGVQPVQPKTYNSVAEVTTDLLAGEIDQETANEAINRLASLATATDKTATDKTATDKTDKTAKTDGKIDLGKDCKDAAAEHFRSEFLAAFPKSIDHGIKATVRSAGLTQSRRFKPGSVGVIGGMVIDLTMTVDGKPRTFELYVPHNPLTVVAVK